MYTTTNKSYWNKFNLCITPNLVSSDDQIKQVINKQVLRYLPYEQPIELDTFVNNTIKKSISRSKRSYTSDLRVGSKRPI